MDIRDLKLLIEIGYKIRIVKMNGYVEFRNLIRGLEI